MPDPRSASATMLPGLRRHPFAFWRLALQMAGGLDLWDKSLPPVTDIASLQGVVHDFIAQRAIPKSGWVVVWQYNDEALKRRRHHHPRRARRGIARSQDRPAAHLAPRARRERSAAHSPRRNCRMQASRRRAD